MSGKTIIRTVAFIELGLGLSTIFTLITYNLLSLSTKPVSVFIFVLISAVISFTVGLGLLNHKEHARVLLVFFSGYIIITKALIFSGLLYFSGEVMTFIPVGFKNLVSVIYHGFLMLLFTRQRIKGCFK